MTFIYILDDIFKFELLDKVIILHEVESMKMLTFTGGDFKAFIEFICGNDREDKSDDVSVLTQDGLEFYLHVEDESYHLCIHKNHRNVI